MGQCSRLGSARRWRGDEDGQRSAVGQGGPGEGHRLVAAHRRLGVRVDPLDPGQQHRALGEPDPRHDVRRVEVRARRSVHDGEGVDDGGTRGLGPAEVLGQPQAMHTRPRRVLDGRTLAQVCRTRRRSRVASHHGAVVASSGGGATSCHGRAHRSTPSSTVACVDRIPPVPWASATSAPAPAARRTRRAAGAPPRRAAARRTGRGGSTTARRRWCSAAAPRRGAARPTGRARPPRRGRRSPAPPSESSTVMVNES